MSSQNTQSQSTYANNRVVVTGMGAVTPLGLSMNETWQNLLKGQSGIGKITQFDATAFDAQIAGEVKSFNPDLYIHKKEQKKMDLFIQYSMAATQMALEQSGLKIDDSNSEKIGVIVGVGIGGLGTIEQEYQKYKDKGPGRISPFFIPQVITNLAAGQISIQHGIKGLNYSITSACATGAHSIGEAYRYIREGVYDAMVAGGSESTVCASAIGGFAAMRALSTRNDAPEKASRPFDKDRDGFVLSEGAAILILENYETAKKRGATILAEVVGYGFSSDAHHMTNPAPGGAGAQAAMRMAIKNAGLNPEQINYINAHGTSTPVGDEMETLAVKGVFGDHAHKLWVSSTKSAIGHTLGAAGAIESAICVNTLTSQVAPPTINLENPSEACDLDYVPHTAREGKLQYVLNNSFGFGGTNASLIFAKI